MERRFIPRRRPGSSRIRLLFSKASGPSCKRSDKWQVTSDELKRFAKAVQPCHSSHCNEVILWGRVMGAWWPSRSSKPLSVRFTDRGVFDSLPLRQPFPSGVSSNNRQFHDDSASSRGCRCTHAKNVSPDGEKDCRL